MGLRRLDGLGPPAPDPPHLPDCDPNRESAELSYKERQGTHRFTAISSRSVMVDGMDSVHRGRDMKVTIAKQ